MSYGSRGVAKGGHIINKRKFCMWRVNANTDSHKIYTDTTFWMGFPGGAGGVAMLVQENVKLMHKVYNNNSSSSSGSSYNNNFLSQNYSQKLIPENFVRPKKNIHKRAKENREKVRTVGP